MMERNLIVQKLKNILEQVLEHNNFEMVDLSAKDVDGWDSLTHMLIITEIESALKLPRKELGPN
jgi:acyl carrier protein